MEGGATKRTKVTIVINDFLIGGAQKLIVDILTRIDRERFDVSLITLFRFGAGEEEYLYDALPNDIPVYQFNFAGVLDISEWISLYRRIEELDPDVVLSNLFFSNTVTRVLSLFLRYRVIIVEHNTYTKKARLHQLIDRMLLGVTERIVAVSNTVAEFTAKQEGIGRNKFTVIHNGIDIEKIRREAAQSDLVLTREEFGLTSEHAVFINIARVVPQKNHRLLLDGFALFVPEHPEARLLIVGGGSHLERTEQYAKETGLTESVSFLGYRKDIPRLLAIADFFVSTSLIEGFGIGHAEALACGVPVLTTKTAGPDEMIQEGQNGYFIQAYTKEAVLEGFRTIVRGNRAKLRDAARHSSEQYSIVRAVEAYETLFNSAGSRHT